MNPYTRTVFELGREAMELAALDAQGLPVRRDNHHRHIADAEEIRTEGRHPADPLAAQPNPHDD